MIVLKNNSIDGIPLEATFLPERGMNMISYKKAEIEVIEQSTRDLFEERYSGLGPIIGPHFHRRHEATLPAIRQEELFPHIARIRAKGIIDPFSHGIARYAPWQYEATETSIKGVLSGKDKWNDIPIEELEGQNFKMHFDASLFPEGLKVALSVVSDTNSLVGLHYFYHLPKGIGKISGSTQNYYLDKEGRKEIPPHWLDNKRQLQMSLGNEALDYTFHPYPNPLQAEILLETTAYRLKTVYYSSCQENSWQLYHPQGANFVCIEPISAAFPKHPILTVSSISALLSIL